MNVYDFGRELIRTNDLDPLYVALHEARPRIGDDKFKRLLLAFWCFYHPGTASWCANPDEEWVFWGRMLAAAGDKKYPRCRERRHFRGDNALESVRFLTTRGVDNLLAPLLGGPYPSGLVIEHVKTWRGFGPWIAFKAADMLERLGLTEIVFAESDALYDSPRKAAQTLWEEEGSPPLIYPETSSPGTWAVGRILTELGDVKAPPRYERRVNVQEAETILCKWGSYRNGHYRIGEDVEGLRHALARFPCCDLSQELRRGAEKGGLW